MATLVPERFSILCKGLHRTVVIGGFHQQLAARACHPSRQYGSSAADARPPARASPPAHPAPRAVLASLRSVLQRLRHQTVLPMFATPRCNAPAATI
jgi:hypothetical protein